MFRVLFQAVWHISILSVSQAVIFLWVRCVVYLTVFLCGSNLLRIFRCALFSCGCCNQWPQAGWLRNNRNIFSHSPEGQKAEVKVLAGPSPLSAPGGPGVLWLVKASSSPCLCVHMAFLLLCLCVLSLSGFLSSGQHQSLYLEGTLHPGKSHLQIFTWMTSAEPLVPKKVTFWDSGWTDLWGRHNGACYRLIWIIFLFRVPVLYFAFLI